MGVVRVTCPIFLNFAPVICLDSVKLGTSNGRLPPKGICSGSCDIFEFFEIRDNISETVHDRDMVAMEV